MTCHHEGQELVWEATVEVPDLEEFSYKYAVVTSERKAVRLEQSSRLLQLPASLTAQSLIELQDAWQAESHPANLLSKSAFADAIFQARPHISGIQLPEVSPGEDEVIVRFQTWCWAAHEGDKVEVVGTIQQLGSGDRNLALELKETDTPNWAGQVSVPVEAFPFTYKYLLTSRDGKQDEQSGEARTVSLPSDATTDTSRPAVILRSDGPFASAQMWRGSGIAVPVFSLRTMSSIGAGEFSDLKKLADFCAATGIRLIQLLPVNDTSVYLTWWDSYPYSCVSVFALHPLYLSLESLTDNMPGDIQDAIDEARSRLNGKDVDYEQTVSTKIEIAQCIFGRQGKEDLESPEFQEFFASNKNWLEPYALFCVLRKLFGTTEHWQWGTLSTPTPEMVERLTCPSQEHYTSLQFTYYLQYHLHKQLLDASRHAARQHVALKGDLPIGVSKQSVDTWMHPNLFRMEYSTGAPPDYFDRNGQNWGFPTYNWEEMSKDDYAWWRQRLSNLSQYFHAYRIDHILGFFRIWEIPGSCSTGLLGHFRPSIPHSADDLNEHGIRDIDRLTFPYITWTILQETFGKNASQIVAKYLIEFKPGYYRFRPEVDTEQKVEEIQARPGSPDWLQHELAQTRTGLAALHQNVILLPKDKDRSAFYPRIQLMDTSSYQAVDGGWKQHLSWLHNDYFYHRHNKLWSEHALRTLPVLMGATNMLVCGEDLGMIPTCVPPVLQQLGLIGLRIQRMPSEENQEFGNPTRYDYMTVASPSCHDTSTTRAWWEEDAERRERFFYLALGLQGKPPAHCTPAIMRTIVRQHLQSPSILAIFPMQDIMALSPTYISRPAHEETINDPAVRRHYWRWRMHVSLEDLLEDTDLIGDIQELMLGSGRCLESDLPVLHTQ
ncbi:hypothetical protein WJX84_012023 [Apatococcus fuscideae]|uniref:4-alpha-glucanotransferase n=1 Tax=Apatococcus fuscideae TaxID=2026836 RepID=A0AAW1STS1_9CHLO